MKDFNQQIKFNDEMLEILDYSRENFIPTMLSSTARFLYDFVRNGNFKNILEIGTAVGYSGILMLKASSEANLTTVELNQERFLVATENFKKFNLQNRVNLINEDGVSAITKLKEQNKKFDLK